MNENSIFQGLKDYEPFRRQFVLSFLDIANVNFDPETVEELLVLYDEDLTWLEEFFLKRFDYIVPDMAEEMGLTGTLENVTLEISDPEAGTITLNTAVPDLSSGSWTGRYYTDYPVTLTANANEGYHFAGWEGSVSSSEASIEAEVSEGGIVLKAIFEKD